MDNIGYVLQSNLVTSLKTGSIIVDIILSVILVHYMRNVLDNLPRSMNGLRIKCF